MNCRETLSFRSPACDIHAKKKYRRVYRVPALNHMGCTLTPFPVCPLLCKRTAADALWLQWRYRSGFPPDSHFSRPAKGSTHIIIAGQTTLPSRRALSYQSHEKKST